MWPSAIVLRDVWLLLYWAWVASEIVVLVRTRTRRGGGEVHDRGSLIALWITIVGSFVVGSWLAATRGRRIAASWPVEAGLALLAAGFMLRWVAILTLGSSFSANVAVRATQTLYRTGVFAVLRHPSYSGLLLILAGIGLHTRSWIGLAIVLLPSSAAVLYRIRVEEAALTQAFGADYTRYSRTTWRLVPGVW